MTIILVLISIISIWAIEIYISIYRRHKLEEIWKLRIIKMLGLSNYSEYSKDLHGERLGEILDIRYSYDLLCNRFAAFFAYLLATFKWAVAIILICVFVVVIYRDADINILWIIPVVMIIDDLFVLLVMKLVFLFTGRECSEPIVHWKMRAVKDAVKQSLDE